MAIWPGPRDRTMAWNNRRVLAERLRWPLGALQECEWLERDHPEWTACWRHACAWSGKPAGYYARRHNEDGRRYPEPYGATPQELVAEMEKAPKRYW